MPVDLLAFGPHPDDIEIGMGGTVALHVARGASVGLCDLTRGERGSNGTPEERVSEAEAARAVLGAAWRENLGLPDGALSTADAHVRAIVGLVRRTRPTVIAIPHGQDRHPDHASSHALLVRAIFDAGLRRYPADGEPWRPARVVSYFINDGGPPSFVLDVSAHYETKRAALACFRSQFQAHSSVPTRLNSPLFQQLVESRDAQFGALAGVRWAEGFAQREPIVLPDLLLPETAR